MGRDVRNDTFGPGGFAVLRGLSLTVLASISLSSAQTSHVVGL